MRGLLPCIHVFLPQARPRRPGQAWTKFGDDDRGSSIQSENALAPFSLCLGARSTLISFLYLRSLCPLETISVDDLFIAARRNHMTQQSSKFISILGTAAANAWAALAESCCAVFAFALGERPQTYRPEAYYMRGPGPKWREKHAQLPR